MNIVTCSQHLEATGRPPEVLQQHVCMHSRRLEHGMDMHMYLAACLPAPGQTLVSQTLVNSWSNAGQTAHLLCCSV
jgi:hypothetical protein